MGLTPALSGLACVFAKPPLPGAVKTRLVPPLTAPQAAALAGAFFEDTLDMLRGVPALTPVVATTGPWPAAFDSLLGDLLVWQQGGGDLGERMERVLRRALDHAPVAVAIGTDSPGLPAERLKEAVAALQQSDAVLGPSEDGGFYLIGLRRCTRGLLAELPWSAADTCVRTEERLQAWGLRTARLKEHFDVDRPEDLTRLEQALRAGSCSARATAEWFVGLRRPGVTR